jgi:hypothetical protein
VGEVISELEVDRGELGELEPAHVFHQLGEAGGPAAGLPAPYRPERLALPFIGALVDEEPHRRIDGLAGPYVPLERTHADDVSARRAPRRSSAVNDCKGDPPAPQGTCSIGFTVRTTAHATSRTARRRTSRGSS